MKIKIVKSKKPLRTIDEVFNLPSGSFQKYIKESDRLIQKYKDYSAGRIQLTEQEADELLSKVMPLLV